MQNLTIDGRRLWDTLHETAAIGATAKGGVARPALSALDGEVRDWLRAACTALGCTVTVDEVGNMFALRPGRRTDVPPIAIGSHLDTQPTGGKFDGVLGVLAGLEVLRTLHDLGYTTNAPILLVNWTNEEGSRFAPAMLGSGVYAGAIDPDAARARADRDGVRFGDALAAIGYRGDVAAGAVPIGAMVELHIEQGPILEAEGITIGVVQGVQAIRWFDVAFTGRDAHSGTTPMALRRDALLAAARLTTRVHDLACGTPPGVGTVGEIAARPNSRNVVPGEVVLTVDLRHPDGATLAGMEAALREAVDDVACAGGLTATVAKVLDVPAITFDPELIAAVRAGATAAGCTTRDIISGAGHDAAVLARVVPSTMIFVPSTGGLSLNEAEWTSREDCTAGATTLLHTVLVYDRRFA
jgi:N-carbamoyl-L-amino-acid hydrolase